MRKLDRYLEYARQHPRQFSAPVDGLITILLERRQIAEAEASMERRLLSHGASQAQARSWSRVGIAFHDPYNFLLRDAVRFGDGSLGTYVRFVDPDEGAPGVIILPLYQGKVVLVRHFRHATRDWSLEIPRGFGTYGHTNEENALSELREEVGGEAARLVSLGIQQPNNGMTAETNELFFAELRSIGKPDIAEGIESLQLTSIPEFEQLIRDGSIIDGFTLCAYARAKTRGLI